MVLIRLLLPATFPNGTASQDATTALSETRRELAETLDGLTANVRSPAKGTWTTAIAQVAPAGMLAEQHRRTAEPGSGKKAEAWAAFMLVR